MMKAQAVQHDNRLDIEMPENSGVTICALSKADGALLAKATRATGLRLDHEGLFVHVPRDATLTLLHKFVMTKNVRLALVLYVEGELRYAQDLTPRNLALDQLEAIVVGESALLTHTLVGDIRPGSLLRVRRTAVVERNGRINWLNAVLGQGAIEQETRLVGQGAHAEELTIYVCTGTDKLRLGSVMLHSAPRTSADIMIKGVLNGLAHCRSDGLIKVLPKSQKTRSYLADHALLVSPHAHADVVPCLEIEADDVNVSHGASMRPIDQEQVFYLRARGVPEDEARAMIMGGFLAPAWDKKWVSQGLRGIINERISAKFSG